MLILSRKKQERILIGDDIEIKVCSIHGGVVQLGITTPKGVPVFRSEIAPSKSILDDDNPFTQENP